MNNTLEENSVIILDSSFDDDLAKAIKNSLQQETVNQSPATSLAKQEEREILRAIENSLKDDHEDEDIVRAIENSLNDFKKQTSTVDASDCSDSSAIIASKSSFNAAHAFMEQSDVLAAYKQKLIASGNYQHSDTYNDELDLVLNYISDTDNFDNGDDIIEILQHHYDELSETQTIDGSVNGEGNANCTEAQNTTNNRLVQYNWFQRLLQFSTTNLRTIVDTTADLAVGMVFPILEEYDIIDVRFLRNILNGKFDVNEAMMFGFDILKKLILLNKLFNEIRTLNLKKLEVTRIVALLKKLGLIKV